MQSGRFVMGVEGDVGFANLDGSRARTDTSLDALGSARARIGFATDQILLYGTGGFGFGSFTVTDPVSRDDRWNLGWILGLGAEFALGRSWSARVEAFHYDLGNSTYVLATGNLSIDVEANVLRAGVNYRY